MGHSKDLLLAMDFGTSNSLVGVASDEQKVVAMPIDAQSKDSSIMRSLVYFADENQAYYGENAIQEFIQNEFEGRLFRSFKSHLPNASYLGTVIGKNRRLPLEELVGLFILQMKKRAEEHLNSEIPSVVFGRPARYSMDPVEDELALHRMKKAAEFAGFKNLYFVPEPLAAAFNYRQAQTEEKIVLIGDFGGGTSDFTIMRMSPQEFKKSDVLAIEGCPLAGDAIDSLFMSQHLNQYFGARVQYKIPMSNNFLKMPPFILDRLNKPAHVVHLKEAESYAFIKEVLKTAIRNEDRKAIDRLLCIVDDNQIFSFFEEIEKTKRHLSDHLKCSFQFNYPGIEINETMERPQLEAWASEFKTQVFLALDRALKQAQLSSASIDLICLTGGSAFVPFIYNEFIERFGKDKLRSTSNFHTVQSGLVDAADLIRRGKDLGL